MLQQFTEARLLDLRELGGDDLVRELIELFLLLTPRRLEGIRAELAAGDLGAVGREAHALVSSSGNLGLIEMQYLAGALQERARAGEGEEAGELAAFLAASFHRAEAALAPHRAACPVAAAA